MNALKRYFEETGENALRLSKRMGRAPATLSLALHGKRNVSMDFALDVERATGGAVSAAEFMAICFDVKKARALAAA